MLSQLLRRSQMTSFSVSHTPYLITFRAEKELSPSRESISGQRFQNHSFTHQEPEEIEEDV